MSAPLCLGRYLLPFPGRDLCPAVEIECQPDPIVELAARLQGVGGDVDKSPIRATFHNDCRAAVPFERRIVEGWVDPAHDARRSYGDAHLALDHKSKAAEHAFFRNAAARS